MTAEAEEEAASPEAGADVGGRGVRSMREFPAMVLPDTAVVAAGQESGPLPSQWKGVRLKYSPGCLFLLTLEVWWQ